MLDTETAGIVLIGTVMGPEARGELRCALPRAGAAGFSGGVLGAFGGRFGGTVLVAMSGMACVMWYLETVLSN